MSESGTAGESLQMLIDETQEFLKMIRHHYEKKLLDAVKKKWKGSGGDRNDSQRKWIDHKNKVCLAYFTHSG